MFPHLRLDIDVTIGVNEDIENARREMLSIIKGDERFMKEPVPVVLVQELGRLLHETPIARLARRYEKTYRNAGGIA